MDWFTAPELWPWILSIVKVWQGAGFGSIIYLAALSSISDELYEAAKIDGASRVQMVFRISLPLLGPTISMLTLIAVGRIFYGDFAAIYSLVGDNGLLLPTTDVIDTYVFRALRKLGDFGMAGAIGLFQSLLGLILLLTVNLIVRKISKESSLF